MSVRFRYLVYMLLKKEDDDYLLLMRTKDVLKITEFVPEFEIANMLKQLDEDPLDDDISLSIRVLMLDYNEYKLVVLYYPIERIVEEINNLPRVRKGKPRGDLILPENITASNLFIDEKMCRYKVKVKTDEGRKIKTLLTVKIDETNQRLIELLRILDKYLKDFLRTGEMESEQVTIISIQK